MKTLRLLLFLLAPWLAHGQGVMMVDTINDLRNLRVNTWQSTNRAIIVNGYWSANDGGGGGFAFDAGVPVNPTNVLNQFSSLNAATLVAFPDGYWYRTELQQPVDIRLAGGVLSTSAGGRLKNNVAIQCILDNNMIPFLPSGTVGYDQPVRLHWGSQIRGAGMQNAILRWYGTNITAMYYDGVGPSGAEGQDLDLSDFALLSNGSIGGTYFTGSMLGITNVYRLKLDRMRIGGYADYALAGGTGYDCTNAVVHISAGGGSIANQVYLTNCRIEKSAGDGIRTEQYSGGAATILNVISGNISGITSWGINQTNRVGVDSAQQIFTSGGLYVEGCNAGGIHLVSALSSSVKDTSLELVDPVAIGLLYGRDVGVPPDSIAYGLALENVTFGFGSASCTNFPAYNETGDAWFTMRNCNFVGSVGLGSPTKELVHFGYGSGAGTIDGWIAPGPLAGHVITTSHSDLLTIRQTSQTRGSQDFVSGGQGDYHFTINTNWFAATNGNVSMSGALDVTGAAVAASVAAASVDVRDSSSLAAESLASTSNFGVTWTVAGDFSVTATNTAKWISATMAAKLSQASGSMSIAPVADSWYQLVYFVTNNNIGLQTTVVITNTFASGGFTFDNLANGLHTNVFKTTATPGNFDIHASSPLAGNFQFYSISLKRITGGNLSVMGNIVANGTMHSSGTISSESTATLPAVTVTNAATVGSLSATTSVTGATVTGTKTISGGTFTVVTNIVFTQATLNELTAAVADMDLHAYQLITATNAVNFIHATNNAAGKGITILIDANGSNRTLTIPSSWFRRGVDGTITNGTIGALSLYGYGSSNTNIIATYSAFVK